MYKRVVRLYQFQHILLEVLHSRLQSNQNIDASLAMVKRNNIQMKMIKTALFSTVLLTSTGLLSKAHSPRKPPCNTQHQRMAIIPIFLKYYVIKHKQQRTIRRKLSIKRRKRCRKGTTESRYGMARK